MLESNEGRLAGLKQQKQRLVDAYTTGVLGLDEIAVKKIELDKQINELPQAVKELRAVLEPQLLTHETVAKIERLASQIREGADLAKEHPDAQRRLFRLLDVQVKLSYDGQRWADVRCNLGTHHFAVEYNNA